MKATKNIIRAAAVALSVAIGGPALAAGTAPVPPTQEWSFGGLFGTFDRASAQRGFQVYQEVCAGCHGLNYIAFRNLLDLGLSENQVKAIASEYEVKDGPNDDGEMFDRPARLSDRWPSPFPNDKAARAANNGALPPDLSLIVEARGVGEGGSNYLHALLTGYVDPPGDTKMMEGMYYNAYYPGHQIAMPSPLADDGVEYADGTKATIEQQSRDVTTFLTWAAEPNMEERKRTGVMVIVFLLFMVGLTYVTKRAVWKDVH